MGSLLKFVKFPSNVASMICGLYIPIFVKIAQWLAAYSNQNEFLSFVWIIIGFGVPASLSVFDFKYKYYKKPYKGSVMYLFRPPEDKKVFQKLMIPEGKRMIIMFVSSLISSIVLMKVGIFEF
ncbi:hypothetical protein LJC22_05655 [Desulfosarcina sp. OttesenSCG-928-G10]|nr:hypothetical protein [Desulfosarcina sp. OttesenSCG-928-G10]MDL2321882.1 hypothetical protein [Desulfosarcina sp. OttesenSCG-928-B08]